MQAGWRGRTRPPPSPEALKLLRAGLQHVADSNANPSLGAAPAATRCGEGEGREPRSRAGSTAVAGGQGRPVFWQGSPSAWLPQASGAGGESRGLEEEPLRTASSPCAPACPRLTPGLTVLLPTPEKLFQAMAVLAVGFTTWSPGAVSQQRALRCAPRLLSDHYAFFPSGAFLNFLRFFLFYFYFLGECKSQKQGP